MLIADFTTHADFSPSSADLARDLAEMIRSSVSLAATRAFISTENDLEEEFEVAIFEQFGCNPDDGIHFTAGIGLDPEDFHNQIFLSHVEDIGSHMHSTLTPRQTITMTTEKIAAHVLTEIEDAIDIDIETRILSQEEVF